MFNARVILQSTDAYALIPALDAFAREAGLRVPPETLPSEGPARTYLWRRALASAALEEMRATFDAAMACGYVEFSGQVADDVAKAVAKARQQWPVRLPVDLVHEAVSAWRARPSLLPCAALGVTTDVEHELAQAVFDALCEPDDAIWTQAASAAALMPATQSHWLLSTARAVEQDESRRLKLEQLMEYLHGSTGERP